MPWRYINSEVIHKYTHGTNWWSTITGLEWWNEPPLLCLAGQRSHTRIINFVNGVYYTYGSTYSRNGSYVPYMQYKMFTFIIKL